MKKGIIGIIVVIIVLICSILIGNYLYKSYEKTEPQKDISENIIVNEISSSDTNIKQRGELNTRGLFELGDGKSSYETDLMANDKTWNQETSLYYKIITNMEDYNKYKDRIILPEMNDSNFEKAFLVIVANENIRSEDETDLMISNVISNDTTTQIIMSQKENPSAYNINNVFYAIVENVQLKENIEVKIEH